MENRRNCCAVIANMLLEVPLTEESLIADLEWNLDDASYKAPEQTIQWVRTHETLLKHIPKPTEEWHFKVLSIFSTMSVEDIKKDVNDFKVS